MSTQYQFSGSQTIQELMEELLRDLIRYGESTWDNSVKEKE